MTRAILIGLAVAASACSAPERTASDFADDPAAAVETVADCEAGVRRADCSAAREGLAEARRRERMDAYARTFREP